MSETEAGLRLLYIDDDDGFARLVSRALARQGFTTVHAAGGEAGLAALDEAHFDAVVLDHMMPGLSGAETLRAITRREAPPPVVYVTAADAAPVAVKALKAGAADYMLKDAGEAFFELLGQTIRQAVANQRAHHAHAAAQAEIAAARDRAEAMLTEVNHRVANSLALVSSFAHLQAAQMAEGEGRDAIMDLKRRIVAIGQVHRRLYTSVEMRRVDLRAYLEGLVEELRASLADYCTVTGISIEIDDVQLPTDRAIALGVIVSELVTNACKYAYAPGTSGDVRVTLRIDGEHLLLQVADDGIGIGDALPKGTGLGRRIIQAMSKSLKGELNFEPGAPGTRATMRFSG